VLGKVFGPQREYVTGHRRKLHVEKLCDLYSPPNIIQAIKIKEDEIGGACGTYGIEEKCMQSFGEKS
jgi:hypothetical protein